MNKFSKKIICISICLIMLLAAIPAMGITKTAAVTANSPAGTSNPISGITVRYSTKDTGIFAWDPESPAVNNITRSSDWTHFMATSISQLKAGDVIVWKDDITGMWNRHVAIIVDVAADFSWYESVDGNLPVRTDRPTGIDFAKRYVITMGGAENTKEVIIWRNNAHGEDIATSARYYTQKIIDSVDTSFVDEYNSIGWGWCYCYATEVLLHVNDAATVIAENEVFSDVADRRQSNYKPIHWAYENGIIVGYKDGTFRPQNNCTRSQFVTMLWRMAGRPDVGIPELENWSPFTDVSQDMSAFRAICWASDAGIIVGYKDGTFRPQEPLTRSQIVVMIWRMLDRPAAEATAPFSDCDPAHSNYRAIQWAAEAGVVKGYKNGNFGPFDNCTRSQLTTILYRAVREGLLTVKIQSGDTASSDDDITDNAGSTTDNAGNNTTDNQDAAAAG